MKRGNKRVPAPASGGLVLSYKCSAKCRHCMYACGPDWPADWLSEPDMEAILEALAPHITPAPGGRESMGLSDGLHFTGGEPFLKYDLLLRGIETAAGLGIPSLFAETNCSWCVDDKSTLDRLRELKSKGMVGIMISVNPFYLEYVPFERTQRCIDCSLKVFGRNTAVYQTEYYHRFLRLGVSDRMPLEKYIQLDGPHNFLHGVEFFMQGRAPYAVPAAAGGGFPSAPPDRFFGQRCPLSPVRPWHNHFDNYGNYMPGFCGGLSYGDIRELPRLLDEGVDPAEKPVLALVMAEDIEGLFQFAAKRGYTPREEGYHSICHLCMDARKYLAQTGDFAELRPREFYSYLETAP